eukprot:322783-Chlamydomonas_euryale.AAC.6
MGDSSPVDETFKKLQSHKGVLGVVVINADGIAVKSTFDNEQTVQYASLVSHFTTKCRSVVKKLDGEDELKLHQGRGILPRRRPGPKRVVAAAVRCGAVRRRRAEAAPPGSHAGGCMAQPCMDTSALAAGHGGAAHGATIHGTARPSVHGAFRTRQSRTQEDLQAAACQAPAGTCMWMQLSRFMRKRGLQEDSNQGADALHGRAA